MYLHVSKRENRSHQHLAITLQKRRVVISQERPADDFHLKARQFHFYFWATEFSLIDVLKGYPSRIDLNQKLKIQLPDEVEKKIRNILTRIDKRLVDRETTISLESFVYLIYLINWAHMTNRIEDGSSVMKSDKITLLLTLMEKNHNQNRQIEYYSRQVPISARYISELCHSELNMGFRALSDLLLIIRILDLFYQKRMTMGEIAHELHFTDQAHFSNYFKSKMLITPTQFKRKILI